MINSAVIGCNGYWGPKVTRVAKRLTNVLYLCDINPSAGMISDYEEILKDSAVDAVFIVTPIDTHFEIAKKCLLSGKHIFVEKPLCSTKDELDVLEHCAAERGLKIFTDYIFLYSDKISTLKQLISSEDVRYVEMTRENFGAFSSSGVVKDLLPHDVSILWYLFGNEVKLIHYDGVSRNGVDVKATLSVTVGDINCVVKLSWLNPTKTRGVKVYCSDKIITYDDITDIINVFNFSDSDVPEKLVEDVIVSTNLSEPLEASVNSFLHRITCDEENDFHITRNLCELFRHS